MKSNRNIMILVFILSMLITACGGANGNNNATLTAGDNNGTDANNGAASNNGDDTENGGANNTANNSENTTEDASEEADEMAASSSLCNNPYYPAEEGKTWHYLITTEGLADSHFYISFENVTENGFTLIQTGEEFRSEVDWSCTDAGLTTAQYANTAFTSGYLAVDTLSASGITLPPAAQMVPGNSWSSAFEIVATSDIGGLQFDTHMIINITETAIVEAPFSNAAGDFDSLQTEQAGTLVATSTINGTAIETTVPLASQFWYGYGVGLLRSESSFEGFASVMELVEIINE